MKVIRMNAPRLDVLLSLLVVCCLPTESLRVERQAVNAQELSSAMDEISPDTEVDTQLRINKTTLLENKSDKNRVDAATLLLFSETPAAREIVLDVLKRTDNPQARAAICEALNPARVWQRPLKKKEDFVKPLIAILTSEEDPAIAKPAAEATLIFGYSQVQQDLEKAATDPSLSVNVRMNVIYALKRHPDKEAVAKLISLLESPDPQIVEAVRIALASVGISVSQDPAAQRQMLVELQQRGVEAFLRERLIRQETRVRELETDLSAWQKRYLTALGGLYDSLADDAAKNAFLAQQLSSSEIVVRSWTLDKLQELRKGTGKLKLSELEPILLSLISDPSRQVRLRTARLLALMGELNVAKPLLEQLKVEPDDQVRREILVALREACYVGSLATTGHKIPEEVRKETLEWAVKFLNEADVEKVRSGAEVIGKLLEQDGLKPENVERYLKSLSDRYAQASAGADPGMRAYLLGAMAGLCATRSTCREQAVKLYSVSFEQAITDKADVVRQNAVDGLVNIDKPGALRRLRENMATDSSVAIRQKLIDLAGEIGGPQDLDWLAEKVGVAGEGEPAWQAMLKIFRSPRSDLATLANWAVKIEVLATAGKVVVEQRIAFFTLVEQKAKSENKADLLKDVRTNLAQLYVSSNNLKQASEYLKMLLGVVATAEEKQRVQSQLLRVYLGLASMEQVSDLVSECLSARDVDLTNGFVVKSIEEYLNSPTTTDPGALLGSLQQQVRVKDPETLRAWRAVLSRWAEKFAKAKKVEVGNRVNN
jgi:HEAT repeat protein